MRLKHILLIFTFFFLTYLKAQSTASKQVTTFSIEAPQLDSVKKIWVYLPKNYQYSEKRYPYLLQVLGPTRGQGRWLVVLVIHIRTP